MSIETESQMNETFGKIKGKKGNALSSLFLLLNNTIKTLIQYPAYPAAKISPAFATIARE